MVSKNLSSGKKSKSRNKVHDYQLIEKKMYEQSWSEMKGQFSKKKFSYRSQEPSINARHFLKFLNKSKVTGTLLDVGCGNGRHTVFFAKNGFKASGIDFAKQAISLARKNAKLNNIKIDLRVGSVFDLPYKTDQFDVILDSGCLHHLRKSEWNAYKKNILKVLKKGGHYALHCFSKKTPPHPPFSPRTKNRSWTLRRMHYNHFFTKKEVMDFFGKDFRLLEHYQTNKDSEDRTVIFEEFYMRKK